MRENHVSHGQNDDFPESWKSIGIKHFTKKEKTKHDEFGISFLRLFVSTTVVDMFI